MVDGQRLEDVIQVHVVHFQAQLVIGVMRNLAVHLNELVSPAASQVVDGHHIVVDVDMAFFNFPNSVVEHQLRRVDIDIGLETAIGAAVQQGIQVQVAVEIMLHGHAPSQISVDAVILAAGIQVQVNHALLGRITRLGVEYHLVGKAVKLHQQARLLDDLVAALYNQRCIHHQVKGRVTLVQVGFNNRSVSQPERQIMHLVQCLIGIDHQIQVQVVGNTTMAIVGIVTEVLREGVREHVLDGGHNRLEVILARHETVQVVTVDADDLVDAVVIGIQLQ